MPKRKADNDDVNAGVEPCICGGLNPCVCGHHVPESSFKDGPASRFSRVAVTATECNSPAATHTMRAVSDAMICGTATTSLVTPWPKRPTIPPFPQLRTRPLRSTSRP